LLDGYRHTALLYAAAKLGLADLLAPGPQTSGQLADKLGAHAPTLHRLLRGLVVVGICTELRDGRFTLTRLGSWLRTGAPGSLHGAAILCGEEYAGAWNALWHSAATGETAFRHAYGLTLWEHRAQHPHLAEHFNAGLGQGTARAAAAILDAYDFSAFQTIADVGGGQGALLAAILRANPASTGILFDLPMVVAGGGAAFEAAGVAARCRTVGGSFLEEVPPGADVLVLRSVIHDWDDTHSLIILRNCRRALEPQGKLLLIERMLPTRTEHDPATVWVDLHMLAATGGRERTEAEYRSLLASAGFAIARVVETRSPFWILEAVPTEKEDAKEPWPMSSQPKRLGSSGPN
jgi:SAM-dependent methyltransferase